VTLGIFHALLFCLCVQTLLFDTEQNCYLFEDESYDSLLFVCSFGNTACRAVFVGSILEDYSKWVNTLDTFDRPVSHGLPDDDMNVELACFATCVALEVFDAEMSNKSLVLVQHPQIVTCFEEKAKSNVFRVWVDEWEKKNYGALDFVCVSDEENLACVPYYHLCKKAKTLPCWDGNIRAAGTPHSLPTPGFFVGRENCQKN